MTSDSCLICENKTINYKNWNQYTILICNECSFSYIKKNKIQMEEVFSPTEKSFYYQSIASDKIREDLFIKKIVKNRIYLYEKILKRKPLNILEVGCGTGVISDGFLHIDVPNDRSMLSCLRKLFKNNKFYGAIRPPYHLRAYSTQSLNKLFSQNNFYNIKTFSKINFDRTFGQLVVKLPFKIALLFRLQQLTGMNSLLVGLAQKK